MSKVIRMFIFEKPALYSSKNNKPSERTLQFLGVSISSNNSSSILRKSTGTAGTEKFILWGNFSKEYLLSNNFLFL